MTNEPAYSIISNVLVKCMREWLSGGASPCQGEGRGFDPRLALFLFGGKLVNIRLPVFFTFFNFEKMLRKLSIYAGLCLLKALLIMFNLASSVNGLKMYLVVVNRLVCPNSSRIHSSGTPAALRFDA